MFVSPKWDYCMKELFRNPVIQKHFLSDVLGIPLEEIKSVKLLNTHLWKQYRREKQGIVDVLMELNNNRKINVELQVKAMKNWDRRQLFYLAKMLADEVTIGKQYDVMRRCVSISILNFNLSDAPDYHRKYLFRGEDGDVYSDIAEIHVIELNKALKGLPIDDWIRLYNAETEEDLDMLKAQTKNAGIKEAVDEVKAMSLTRWAKAQYDEYWKQVMDRKAREDYVRDEGIELGKTMGRAEGIAEGRAEGRVEGIAEGIAEGRAEGRTQGKAEGRTETESQITVLIEMMTAAGEGDKLPQLSNKEFLHEMLEKFGL